MSLIFRLWGGGRSREGRSRQAVMAEPGKSPDCWRVASDVRASIHARGGVLFQQGTAHIFTCNPIGAEIWQILEDGFGDEQLERLAQRHGRPPDGFILEALRFIELLKEYRLIVPGGKK